MWSAVGGIRRSGRAPMAARSEMRAAAPTAVAAAPAPRVRQFATAVGAVAAAEAMGETRLVLYRGSALFVKAGLSAEEEARVLAEARVLVDAHDAKETREAVVAALDAAKATGVLTWAEPVTGRFTCTFVDGLSVTVTVGIGRVVGAEARYAAASQLVFNVISAWELQTRGAELLGVALGGVWADERGLRVSFEGAVGVGAAPHRLEISGGYKPLHAVVAAIVADIVPKLTWK